MTYTRRMAICSIAAVGLHLVLLAALAHLPRRTPDLATAAREERPPIVVDLQQPARRLVETNQQPEEQPQNETDLISDRSTRASDLAPGEGDDAAPQVDRLSDFEDPGASAAAPVPPSAPQPPAQAQQPAPPEAQTPPEDPAESEEAPEAAAPPEQEIPASEAPSDLAAIEPPMEETPAPEEPERVQVARAETPELPEPPEEPAPAAEAPVAPQPSAPAAPQPLADRPEPTEGRFEGNVSNRGFTGFEAMRSDMAPYFLEVRRKVEATWRAVLQVRYSGNDATRCVIDCVIAPDGSLVRAKILEAGDSPTFASLCKMAIERAAPFGPFPVDVPEYYRSRNLEIRWTFSFYD